MNFETIIGIEIHLELNTKTKMFSAAPNAFGRAPNTQVSATDIAFPGTLPRLNKQAVVFAIMACTTLNMEIDNELWFDRKNYFYPDLTKGYQITQDKRPIGKKGYIEIEVNNKIKRIGITRLHMEEDTAKQLHFGDYSLLDYNRCGVPLLEIVSEPDIRSGLEAAKYVEKLRQTILFTGISNVKMEEGSLRCDINISLRPYGYNKFGTKVEIKNLNSISNVQKAIEYEIQRQEKLLLSGKAVEQETRRFDETSKQTILMRKKSAAVDYKYFTEANIMPIHLNDDFINNAKNLISELPQKRFERYLKNGLNDYIASQLLISKEVSDYYDLVMKNCIDSVGAANLILGDVFSYLNKNNLSINNFIVTPANIAELVNLLKKDKISSKQGKIIFEQMCISQLSPSQIIDKLKMTQESDNNVIASYIKEVLDNNAENIALYKAGRDNLLAFFIGQVMKKSQGKANPALTSKMLKEELEKR